MGFLASLFTGPILQAITGSLFEKLESGWEAYVKKEISKEQMLEKMQEALLATFAEVEKAYADSITKGFAAFMDAAAKSKLMQAVWAAVALSQLIVLLWHQMGIPLLCFSLDDKGCFPSSGTTVDWAYALVMFCLGGGAIALKSGPGAGALKDQLKALVAR